MKKSVKKSLFLCAVSAMLIATAISAAAEPTVRPMPGSSQTSTVTSSGTSASNETGVTSSGNYKASDDNSNNSDNDSDNDSDNQGSSSNSSGDSDTGVTRTAPTAIPTTDDGKVSIVTDTEQSSGKKGSVSVGAMILWLLISVIINAGVSFWIGNRFYRLSKKDTHLTSEVRALRRDVEEKFLQSVGGFAEQEIDISNANEDYSRGGEGISMPRRQRQEEASGTEEDELLRKWESRMNAKQSRSSVSGAERRYEPGVRRKYQPTREAEPIDEDYDEEEEQKSGIKSKAKGILNDIFPFKED